MDNPKAKITNKLGIDVDIYDVYNTSGDPKGKLTYTKLGSIGAGKTAEIQTIHFASQLQAMYTGKNDKLNGNYYYQFPMAVFGISMLKKQTEYLITPDDRAGMEQAFQFIKYTTANASSKISKDFVTALGNKEQKKTVDAFFANTGSFKQCSMEKWTAVVAWQTQFTSAWQGPYWLYTEEKGADGTSTVKLIAAISIASDAKSNEALLKMANTDGTVSPDAETTKLTMAGDGSFCEENVGTGNVSVSLQPVWMNVTQTDSKGTTRYLIGSAMLGTINGIKVTGTQQSRTLPDSKTKGKTEAEKQAAERERERQFDRAFSKITSILGLLVGVATVIVMIKQMKSGHTQQRNDAENKAVKEKPDVDPEEVEKDQDRIDSDYESEIEREVEPSLSRTESNLSELPSLNSDLVEIEVQGRTEDMVDQQVDQLEEVLETEAPTDRLEKTAQDLYEVQQDVQEGRFEGVDERLEKIGDSVQTELQESGESMRNYERESLTDVQDAIQETRSQTESVEKAQQEQEDVQEQDPEQEIEDESFDEPDMDPVEFEGGVE